MDSSNNAIHGDNACQNNDYEYDFEEWFRVSGDMDDFIFYGEPYIRQSEK